jgi:hypothetical protein
MQSRTTDGYIWMGTAIRFLRDCKKGWKADGDGWVLTNMDQLLELLTRYDMHVSCRVAEPLAVIADQLRADIGALSAAEDESAHRLLTAEEASNVSLIAYHIQTTVVAEAAGQRAFITRDKRYSVENLLGSFGNLMGPGVFGRMPELAQFDFEQAGKCVAYEVPTAAAFHLMRGTEAVLRDFYHRIVKRERVKVETWGAVTDHMRRRRDTPPDVLMNNLDNLRRSFRNPTQHPEKIYDIDEVQDLMALSIDVVNRMQKHLASVGK